MLKTLVLTTGRLVRKEFAHNAKTLLLISQVIWGLINKLRMLKKLVLISQVVWCERNLLTMFKNHLAAGYGNEGSWAYLSSRLLCLSSLPLSLLCWGQILSTLECCSLRRSLLWRQRIPLPKAIIHMTQQRTKSSCIKSDSAIIAFTACWLLQFQNELTHIYLAWKHVAPITDWPVWKLLSKQRRTGMGSALWNFECVVVTTHDLHCNNSNNNDNNNYWSRNKEQSRFQSRKTILISSRTMLKLSIPKPVVLIALLLWWKNANTFKQRRFKVLSWTDESKGCASEATTNFKPS